MPMKSRSHASQDGMGGRRGSTRALRVRRRQWRRTERCGGRRRRRAWSTLRRTPRRRRRATSRCRSTPSRTVSRRISARPVRSTLNDICSRCLWICRRLLAASLHSPPTQLRELGRGPRSARRRTSSPPTTSCTSTSRLFARLVGVNTQWMSVPASHGCVDVRRRRSVGLPRLPARRRRRRHRHGSRADPRCRHDPSPLDGQAPRRFEQHQRRRA